MLLEDHFCSLFLYQILFCARGSTKVNLTQHSYYRIPYTFSFKVGFKSFLNKEKGNGEVLLKYY